MGLFDKAKELSNAALSKGKDLAEITKLNIDITTLEAKINEAKKNIGNVIVSNNIEIDNAEIKDEISKINDLKNEIQSKKGMIEELQKK